MTNKLGGKAVKAIDTAGKVVLTGKLKRYIDVNTDFGQTRDRAFFEQDASRLLSAVSSVNIPCCVHDGDPALICEAMAVASAHHCAVGAHIGYPDPVHYGYERLDISTDALTAWIHVQLGAFHALAATQSVEVAHVRPHGALYGAFVEDFDHALIVAKAIIAFNPWLTLLAPAGPVLTRLVEETGLRAAPEIYLGKRYDGEGCLSRALFNDDLNPQGALDQARQLVQESALTSADGRLTPVSFRSLHISPRLDGASELAESVYGLIGQPVCLPIAAIGESGWV
ncbi:MAG: LamB/YcsF family protein [Vampirovibrionales bacterium]|nr:LamB/YcsF family protein [Vampirovibrionales bacterium]